jgi:hypothetical protein
VKVYPQITQATGVTLFAGAGMLRQSGNRRIISTDVAEERSMGNAYEAEFAADVDETTNTPVAPAAPVGTSSPERSAAPNVDMGLLRPPFGRETKEGGAGGRLSPRSSSQPRASRSVRSALTWLATFAMEGFAAHGQAMYPCFSDPGTLTDVHAREQNAQPRQQSQKHSGQSFTNPWMLHHRNGTKD